MRQALANDLAELGDRPAQHQDCQINAQNDYLSRIRDKAEKVC